MPPARQYLLVVSGSDKKDAPPSLICCHPASCAYLVLSSSEEKECDTTRPRLSTEIAEEVPRPGKKLTCVTGRQC